MAVAKIIEVTAASKTGLEDAITSGIGRASETLEDVKGAWIKDIKVKCRNGKIEEWRVDMKVTFVLK